MAPSLVTFSGPPGSGKSTGLVHEALRLVHEEGLLPGDIVLIAMTGPGKRHLEALLDAHCAAAGLTHRNFAVLTFETFCRELLRRYSIDIRPDFKLLSREEARLILHGIGRQLAAQRPGTDPLHYTLGRYSFAHNAADLIERLRLCGMAARDIATLSGERGRLLAEFMGRFQECTLARGLLTYPDLLIETARLLNTPDALAAIRQDIRGLLIDEAQELGHLHFNILRPLLPETRLALAGTEHLNTRGFPGSEPGFAELSEVFPETPISPQTPVEQFSNSDRNTAALWLASQWQAQPPYNLPPFWEARPPGDETDSPYRDALKESVRFGFFPDFRSEATAVAGKIREIHRDTGRPWEDFVILLRNSTQPETLDTLQSALTEAGIPVNINGLPEAAFQIQALLFHALKVFEQRQILQGDTDERPLTVMDRIEAVQTLNRHLYEWLVRLPEFAGAGDLLAGLSDENAVLPGTTLLERYRQGHPLSRAVNALLNLLEAANKGDSMPSLYGLCWQILAHGGCLRRLPETGAGEPAASLGDFLETLQQQEANILRATGTPLPLAGFEDWYAGLWGTDKADGNRVRILSLFQCQGQRFPIVFLPGLVAGAFPQTASESHFFTPDDTQALGKLLVQQGLDPSRTRLPLLQDQRNIQLSKEVTLMTLALTRTGDSLFLSTHRNTESANLVEATQPSSFYRELLKNWQTACGEPDWLALIEDEDAPTLGWLGEKTGQPLTALSEDRQYHGDSLWSRLPLQPETPVYGDDEVIPLSPTGVGVYIKCPRQYYYKQVLNLRTDGAAAANVGTAVHKLMEVFNRGFPEKPYTYERLAELAESFFAADPAVFAEKDLAFLNTLDPIAFHDLKNNVLAALEDLHRQGYFDETPQQVLFEKEFRVDDPDWPGVRLTARIDALIQNASGQWDIVDYKYFSKTRFATKNPENELLKVFEPFDPEADSHEERFGTEERYYQVPLYYLASQHEAAYRDNIRDVGLQLIRPAADNGARWVRLSAREIEEKLPALKADLATGIIAPLRETSQMAASPGKACEWCEYTSVCDAAVEVSDE